MLVNFVDQCAETGRECQPVINFLGKNAISMIIRVNDIVHGTLVLLLDQLFRVNKVFKRYTIIICNFGDQSGDICLSIIPCFR